MSEQPINDETQQQGTTGPNGPVNAAPGNAGAQTQPAASQPVGTAPSVQPQAPQGQAPDSTQQASWEYQALQHGWVPPTQDGRQGAQQPAPQQQWQQQQSPQPPAGWQQQGQQQNWGQPAQPNGWQQGPQQQQSPQNSWQQNQPQGQQPAPQNQPKGPDAFNGSTKALWVVAGALAGIFSLLLVLLFGMGRSPQYRAQAIRWACVGIVIGVIVDLALFGIAGITPTTTTGSTGAYPSGGTSPSGSAF